MNIRKSLSIVLKATGVLWEIRHLLSNETLRILMYHRVADREHSSSYYLAGVKPSDFDMQMRFLSKYFSVILLEEVVDCIKNGKKIPRNAVSITVDDGYKDCYTNIYPALKKYNLPATIFLTAGNIGSTNPFWVDKLGYLFKKGKPVKSLYEHPRLSKVELGSHEKRLGNLKYVVGKLKTISEAEKDKVIDDMQEFFQVSDEELKVDYNLSWDQVREMSDNGISFGTHTVTHPILTKVPLDAAEREIKESKGAIEREIGKPVYGFCYPNGEPTDYNDEIIRILKKHGFKYAVTVEWGFNDRNSDLFRLKRVGPNDDDGMAEFECLVSGGFEVKGLLRRAFGAPRNDEGGIR